MTGYEAYKLYLALKSHFNQANYDFFKYKGKVRASVESFEKRRDKYFFEKLGKLDNPRDYLVANLSVNPSLWIRDILSRDCQRVYSEWLTRQQSLTYLFKEDLEKIDLQKDLKIIDGDHPTLFKLYLSGSIYLETISILLHLCDGFEQWSNLLGEDPVWSLESTKLKKILPFITYDRQKIASICKQAIENKAFT